MSLTIKIRGIVTSSYDHELNELTHVRDLKWCVAYLSKHVFQEDLVSSEVLDNGIILPGQDAWKIGYINRMPQEWSGMIFPILCPQVIWNGPE